MRTIYKYPLDRASTVAIYPQVPANFTSLHVGLDPAEDPCLWAEVDPDSDERTHRLTLIIVGTGQSVPPFMDYAGTFVEGAFVWHVYYEHST